MIGRVLILLTLFSGVLGACSSGSNGWLLSERVLSDGGAIALPEAGTASSGAGAGAGAGADAGRAEAGASDAGATSAAGAAGAAPSAGARCPTRFETACLPAVVVNNKDANGSGKLFSDAVLDPEGRLTCITRDVCNVLFRKQTEIKNITQISVVIEPFSGISETWSAGSQATIRVSSSHLQGVADAHRSVQDEVDNLFYYHATNIYQSDGGNGVANGWLVQGVAHYMRHVAGYLPGSERRPGGKYDSGSTTTGFFLIWLDDRYPDFVYELNQSLNITDPAVWSPQAFEDITGQNVNQLWASYQATF